jgi:hypothetical protein
MLFGFIFLSHQIGSFAGLKLDRWVYDISTLYDVMWWISMGLALLAALVHWPIKEHPVARLAVGSFCVVINNDHRFNAE